MPKLRQFLNNHPVLQKIQGIIIIPIHEASDSFYWGLNSSGKFTTKSAAWVAHGIKPHDSSSWSYKWISNIATMPKIRIFIWQIRHKV